MACATIEHCLNPSHDVYGNMVSVTCTGCFDRIKISGNKNAEKCFCLNDGRGNLNRLFYTWLENRALMIVKLIIALPVNVPGESW